MPFGGPHNEMTDTLVTPERVDELLRFLPLFDRPGRSFVESWRGSESTSSDATAAPLPVYSADVQEFFRLASQACWDDSEYEPSAATMLADDDAVQVASITEIRTMLTHCVPGERFCDGHWEGVLRSGRVMALLRRLKVLRSEMSDPAGGGVALMDTQTTRRCSRRRQHE
jgi:hypothetical protein